MNATLLEVSKRIDERFKNIVGQESAKERIKDILLGAAVDGFFPTLLVVGPPGWGKSFFMKALRDIVRDVLKYKTLFAVRGDGLGTKTEFIEELLIPKFHGQKSIVICDEFHEAAKGVQSFIRSMLEPSAEREARHVPYNDSEITFDPFLNSFIIATNKVDELDAAFLSRFERIDLEPFSASELEEILYNGLRADNLIFHDSTLRMIAECNRGSARDIVHWINAIRRRVIVQEKKTINRADCMAVIKSRKTYPKGVTSLELKTLLHLEARGPLQLKELAAMNQSSSTEQDANEKFLRQRGFITTDVKRVLTNAGRVFLAELREDGFIEERAEKDL